MHAGKRVEKQTCAHLTGGKLGTVVQNSVECGMPWQVTENDQTGITFGRMSAIAECPLRVDVGEHEREMSDHITIATRRAEQGGGE